MPKKLSITDMQQIAAERGGKCLSTEYINNRTKLLWECAEGHQWTATPHHIRRGQWCPICGIARRSQKARHTLEDMQILAHKRGGVCLSSEYHNANTPLLWQCADDHRWYASPLAIYQGTWCPECANLERGKSTRLTLEAMQQLASERGGQCLSESYVNNKIPLLWQCRKGHQWQAAPHNIINGTWCPVCAKEQSSPRIRGSLADMQQIAAERGGKCLSTIYWNNKTKLRWQCAEGHIWEATPNQIKNDGCWCPICGGTAKKTLADIQQLAAERRGYCLSQSYVNDRTKLLWQCEKGHTWEATPNLIKRGSWCPECAKINRANRLKSSIEEMQRLAAQHGGHCLSEAYVNNHTKLLWECAEGHQWYTIPKVIKRGQWCPICARQQRKTKSNE